MGTDATGVTSLLEYGVIGATLLMSFGALAFIVRWILNMFATILIKKLDELIANNNEAATRMLRAQSATMAIIVDLQRQLLMHDGQVRGLNPSVGEDVDERVTMHASEVKRLEDAFMKTRDTLVEASKPPVRGVG